MRRGDLVTVGSSVIKSVTNEGLTLVMPTVNAGANHLHDDAVKELALSSGRA